MRWSSHTKIPNKKSSRHLQGDSYFRFLLHQILQYRVQDAAVITRWLSSLLEFRVQSLLTKMELADKVFV